jgi:hypothetical protein
LIIVDALRHVGPNAPADRIRAYIEQLHGFAGTNGLYDFRNGGRRGLGLSSAVVSRWSVAKSEFDPVSNSGGLPLTQ